MNALRQLHCPDESCGSTGLSRAGLGRPVLCLQGARRQLYRCKKCGIRFSNNIFHLSYRQKKTDRSLNFKIFDLTIHGLSNRAIARHEGLSHNCVRDRIARFARRAFVFHAQLISKLRVQEAICMDGLENFAGSQYDPNNINQAIGRDSLFIYDFNFSSLNRKGRKSSWQKMRLEEIENNVGRYDPKSILIASKELFNRLFEKSCPVIGFQLLTDEHFQYRRALKILEREAKHMRNSGSKRTFACQHGTVSSKKCRNFQNILFSVNQVDLNIRQNLGAFKRETISFSKCPGAMIQKYMLYMIYKNYMCPQFTKKHIRRPKAHEQSPAQALKLTEHLLSFHEIFNRRALNYEMKFLNREWKHFFCEDIPPEHQRSLRFVSTRKKPQVLF